MHEYIGLRLGVYAERGGEPVRFACQGFF